MDVAVDLYLAVPLLFTVLAVILASVFVKLRAAEGDKAAETAPGEGSQGQEAGAGAARKAGEGEGKEGEALKEERLPGGEKDGEGAKEERGRVPVEEIGAEEGKAKGAQEKKEQEPKEEEAAVAARTAKVEQQSPHQGMNVPRQAAEAVEEEEEEEEDDEDESKEEDQDWEKERLVVKEPELDDAAEEQISFKYSPGKLRGNQYKTMMTKEELEEEQRTEDYMKLSLASS